MAITGTDASETIKGTSGDETIVAKAGDDRIIAGSGDDVVRAGQGDDTVRGDNGDDTLFAGSGDDEIRGGKGADEMSGQAGADTFVFYAGADFRTSTDDDTIMDFELGIDSLFVQSPGSYQFDLASIGEDLVASVSTHNGVDRGSITFVGLGEEFADAEDLTGAELMALLNSVPDLEPMEEIEIVIADDPLSGNFIIVDQPAGSGQFDFDV